MLKKILIIVPSLLMVAVISRVIYVNLDQKKEFEYHANLEKSIKLYSEGFEQNQAIPLEFTGLGEEVSPSLHWDQLPAGTKSLAITVTDYDGPSPNFKIMTIDHWVLFNIDPSINHIERALSLEELAKAGIDVGLNVNGELGYVGPNPPMGVHEYYFRVYALSVPSIDLSQPTRSELMEKMDGNIIAYGELVGTYELAN